MSEDGEVYRDWLEDRDAYGPVRYCQIYWSDDDQSTLPEVDYKHVAYSSWNIRINLYTMVIRDVYCEMILERRKGAKKMEYENGVTTYYTLLYKLALSDEAWDRYEKNIEYIYTGYIRKIVDENQIGMIVTPPLIASIGKYGSWTLYSNLYEYLIVSLDEMGYCWSSTGDESSDEEMS